MFVCLPVTQLIYSKSKKSQCFKDNILKILLLMTRIRFSKAFVSAMRMEMLVFYNAWENLYAIIGIRFCRIIGN